MRDIETMINIIDKSIINETGKSLSFIQKVVLRESLCDDKKTYAKIASENNYSENYIKQLVAPKLWQIISATVNEKVNRTNCLAILEKKFFDIDSINNLNQNPTPGKIILESPDSLVPLGSIYYIERGVEKLCYEEILQPDAFIRISAPQKMGKTSLIARILARGSFHKYLTANISLHYAETDIFSSIERFVRWLCINITRQLKINSKIDEYWDSEIGTLINFTIYLKSYILQEISQPLILAIDDAHKIFDYPAIAQDFLSMLRTWYEETKNNSNCQKLKIVLANSTDCYVKLNTNRSPFNIGLIINLAPFEKVHVKKLLKLHNLKISDQEVIKMMDLTGGYPYLVRSIIYYSIRYKESIINLLETASKDTGIFSNHLREQLWYVHQNPKLLNAMQQVITYSGSSLRNATRTIIAEYGSENNEERKNFVSSDLEVIFKLKSLGLITLEGEKIRVSCGLYKSYFKKYLST
ncbi:MAG: AAA-like domain-containing protein [Cyanobacteria bacterium P01_A01_bin.68]